MLDEPDLEDLGATRSPVLHGTYPPQFDHAQGNHGDFYNQPRGGMPAAQPQQTPPHTAYEHPHLIAPTSHPNHPTAAGANLDVDPDNEGMLDADPFNLGANM